jgi:NTP pyrophosphatase (non-canonical NTP hydrolase)
MTRAQIYAAIDAERARQEAKHPMTCASPLMDEHEKLTVMTEEVGEVARALLDGDEPNKRDELVQVAAVAVAWLESLGGDE